VGVGVGVGAEVGAGVGVGVGAGVGVGDGIGTGVGVGVGVGSGAGCVNEPDSFTTNASSWFLSPPPFVRWKPIVTGKLKEPVKPVA
jgi:hypothetical protein